MQLHNFCKIIATLQATLLLLLKINATFLFFFCATKTCPNYYFEMKPALGVSVKSVHLVAGRLGFYSQSGHAKDFKNSIRSFRSRRSVQAKVRRVLCTVCVVRLVCPLTAFNHS